LMPTCHAYQGMRYAHSKHNVHVHVWGEILDSCHQETLH